VEAEAERFMAIGPALYTTGPGERGRLGCSVARGVGIGVGVAIGRPARHTRARARRFPRVLAVLMGEHRDEMALLAACSAPPAMHQLTHRFHASFSYKVPSHTS
jgi:hypothetical protein